MEKKKALKILGPLVVLGLLATACAAKPDQTTTINCNGEVEFDLPPGEKVKVEVPSENIDVVFSVASDNNLTFYSNPVTTNGNVTIAGDPGGAYFQVTNQGNPDNDSKINVDIKSVCPAPTPTPGTPVGLLKGNVRTLTQADQGFYSGKASKPARNIPVYRRG